MGDTAEGGEATGAFGRSVDYLKDHPPLLFGLAGGMLVVASAKEEARPVTVPLLVLLLASLLVWLAVERARTGSFSFVQGRRSVIRRSALGQGDAPGRRRFRVGGTIEDSQIGNTGSQPRRSDAAPEESP